MSWRENHSQIFGTGRQLRDFNYVDDVVDALLIAAIHPAAVGQIFNLGHSERVNLLQVAEMLSSLREDSRFEVVPFPSDREIIDIGDYYGDFGKIEAALGWRPEVSLVEGLQRTLSYYQEHHTHYWGSES